MLAGLNDTDVCVDELARLAYPMRCHVNLIPYNASGPDDPFRTPTQVAVKAFARKLEKQAVSVTIRKSRGADIAAACGQLRQKHQEEAEQPDDER